MKKIFDKILKTLNSSKFVAVIDVIEGKQIDKVAQVVDLHVPERLSQNKGKQSCWDLWARIYFHRCQQ